MRTQQKKERYTQDMTPPRSIEKRFKIEYRYQNQKLKSQVLALHSYMQRRQKEHQSQIRQLKKQNKHFSLQIMRLQDELHSSKQNKRTKQTQNLLLQLKAHIENVQRQIKIRQDREVKLLKDNKKLVLNLESIENHANSLEIQNTRLLQLYNHQKCKTESTPKQIIPTLSKQQYSRIQQLQNYVLQMSQTNQKIQCEVKRLRAEIEKYKIQNEQVKKDFKCVLELVEN